MKRGSVAAPRCGDALRPFAEALEERVLHSADLGGALLAAPAVLQAEALTTPDAVALHSSVEIVFVDEAVDDSGRLVADLQSQQAAGRPIEVVSIGRGEDGLQVISQALAGREPVSAVHVLAHGSDGRLQLGSTFLDASTLLGRATEVAGWADALAPQADLLLYGCDLGSGVEGRQLLEDLAALTGADVAASTDLTGAAAAGGDWDLEYRIGEVEAVVVPSASFQAGWQGVLATYTVTTSGEGLLAELLGLTLRTAISQANANPGPDEIVFAVDGEFNLAFGSGDDSNGEGDFDITDDLTIIGNGTDRTIISGDGRDRVFDVQGVNVRFSNLTITDGRSSSGAGLRLDEQASAVLDNVVVRNNVGDGGSSGGGIYSEGDLVLRNVRIVDNGDTGSGNIKGAGLIVRSGSTLDALNVEFSGNRAAGNERGGGAYIESSATATFVNVTFTGNIAHFGGGLVTEVDSNTLLRNVTFSGNSASQAGGGLFAQGNATLNHVTVADNSAAQGGGLSIVSGQVSTTNSLFAGNTGGNVSGTVVSGGWNLSTDGTLNLSGPGDRNNVPVTLGALTSDGGFTRTRPLPADSPAIDAADPASTRTLDQRGIPVLGGRADIGAYEYNPFRQAPTITAVADRSTTEDGAAVGVAFSVADAETAAGSLVVTATSSNVCLVAPEGLVLGGTGSNRTLSIAPVANANGSTVITLRVSDGGNATSVSFTLNVTAVNDAPTITLPALAPSPEDQPLDFSAGQSIRIADVDGGSVQVSLSAVDGLLTLRGGTAGLAFVSGSPTAAAAMVFQGTLASVAAALDQLRFTPNRDHVGSARIDIGVNDLGNGGGAPRIGSASLAWTISAVNDAPSLTLPGAQATTFGTALDFSSTNGNAIAISDVDAGGGTLTVTLGVASVAGGATGQLQITDPAAASLVVGTPPGGLVLQGTVAQLNAALGFLRLDPTGSGNLRLDIDVADGGATGSGGVQVASGSIAVSVGGNLAPVVTLSRTTVSTTENAAPIVLDSGLALSDDGSVVTAVTFRIVSGFSGAEDVLGFTPTAGSGDILAVRSGNALTLVSDGGASLAQWQVAAQSVTYVNTSDSPSTTPRSISVVVDDGNSVSAARLLTVQLASLNDAPELAGPGALAAVEEDATDPAGTLVATLIAGLETDRDAADAPGIVVIGLDSAQGRWQYTRDGGGTWLDFGVVSDIAGRLLAADDFTAVRFVPDANWNGSVPAGLSYRAWDGTTGTAGALADASVNGGTTAFSTATAAAGITVLPVNDAPVPGSPLANAAAVEDQPFTFTLPAGAFTDLDGDPLVWTATLASGDALPAWLGFDPATRTFTGTPSNGDVGASTLRVVATDAAGASASATFSLRVSNVNDDPVASAIGPQVTREDEPFEFVLPPGSFVDGDLGDALTLSATLDGGAALPAWLSFDPIAATFRGTPAGADVGSLTLRVTATDESGASASTAFALTVANTNDAPTAVASLPDSTAQEDSPFAFTLPAGLFADEDAGDALTLSAALGDGSPLPAWLSFDAATGRFSGTPANADVGLLTVRVTATDLSGASASSSLSLNVANVNDAPVAGAAIAPQTATEDSPFAFTLPRDAFADEDLGDRLELTASLAGGAALPAWLSFDPSTGRFTGTPANADLGSVSVQVRAVDGAGASASTSFSLTVGNTNDAPAVAAVLPDVVANEDEAFFLRLPTGVFADADGDALTLSASLASGEALPAWLNFDAATGSFRGTPGNADVGALRLQVTATDPSGARVSLPFTLMVANVNDAPVRMAAIDGQVAVQDTRLVLTLPTGLFADADTDDTLTLSASLADGSSLPAWLRFDPASGRLEGLPTQDDIGTLLILVTAQDRAGASAAATVLIEVRTAPAAQAEPLLPIAPAEEAPAEEAPKRPSEAVPPPASSTEPNARATTARVASPKGDAEAGLVGAALGEGMSGPTVTAPTFDIAAAAAPTVPSSDAMEVRSPGSRDDAVLADTLLGPFRVLSVAGTLPLLRFEEMQRSLQSVEESLNERGAEQREVVSSGLLLSGGLSVGYVVWLIRGGVLASSMLSALPAWQMIDPMPVLAAARRDRPDVFPPGDDDQGVERLFEKRSDARSDPRDGLASPSGAPPEGHPAGGSGRTQDEVPA